MVGELVVGPVDLGVVEAGLRSVFVLQGCRARGGPRASRRTPPRDVGGDPLGLIHDQRRPDEEMAAGRQHDHERPEGTPASRPGVEPHPESAVVHLASSPGGGSSFSTVTRSALASPARAMVT